ncbi:hypothetical protein VN24_04230 [Paenibacillus beijingensis]|uniref:Uncharacterized protein n=1 Tax=Paenibacillus beijingensis TaxID=1126833 RepID=A0A0D5NQM9_9BACL|nr:hypothetical protein VN24_04230 [Paenibacillus beijingensis]
MIGWILWRGATGLTAGTGDGAEAVVRQFYTLEQSGDFGSSWELFHSQMKDHFSKDSYIQKRAHVFMQDFGVHSFEFEVGNSHEVGDWRMTNESELLERVYLVPVTMNYSGSFGNFEIVQNCYVTREAEEWKLLWSYGKEESSK